MTAPTRTRPPTHRQQAVLDRLRRLSDGVYYSRGGWVPRSSIGHQAVLRRLVDRGLVETTVAAGPMGFERQAYRPRGVKAAV